MSRWREIAAAARAKGAAKCAEIAKTDFRPPSVRGFGASGNFGNASAPEAQRQELVAATSVGAGDAIELIGERAAILEHDAGMSRAWAEACARMMMLDRVSPPAGVLPGPWRRVCLAAVRLVHEGHAARAASLGWKPEEFFGADQTAPFIRCDTAGLALFVEQGDVVQINADGATITRKGGATTRWRRRAEKRQEPAVMITTLAGPLAPTGQMGTSR